SKDRHDRPPANTPALPGAVVAVMVQVLHPDLALDSRVPEHDVGVAPLRDRPLLWIHAGDARRVHREDLDEALEREAVCVDAFGEADDAARLDPHVATRRGLDVGP